MEMRSEKAAQSTAKATGVWDYIPCYLVKHVGDREVHTLTCANVLLVSMAISDPDFGFGVDPGRLRGYSLAHLAGTWW